VTSAIFSLYTLQGWWGSYFVFDCCEWVLFLIKEKNSEGLGFNLEWQKVTLIGVYSLKKNK